MATPALAPASQALEAAYRKFFRLGGGSSSVGQFLSDVCEPNIGNCDDWGTPPLHGLTFKWGADFRDQNGFPSTTGLDWETMTKEIKAGHPVLFVWDYLSDGTGQHPVGKHELVVTGYSEDDSGAQWLQIWDPWPIPEPRPIGVPACGPASGIQFTQDTHSQRIHFSTYGTPANDMGVWATAVHQWDQWGLAMVAPEDPVFRAHAGAPPAPRLLPPLNAPSQPIQGAVPQLSFDDALNGAMPESLKLDLQGSGEGPRLLGVPFPIVGLGFVQLLGARYDPTKLLAGTTSAILFPVESQGKVVDAFLMLFMEGRWQRGGYANIEITRRLVEFRARYAAQKHVPVDRFYMVSVPGEVAFFAAYGKGKNAILIPASTDPTIKARYGVAVAADRQLKDLIAEVERDLQRYQIVIRGPVRPGR